MSAATPATPPAPAAPAAATELTVISHSSLFYWWPVWAVGFLLGVLTLLEKDHPRMAVVPEKTTVQRNVTGELSEPKGNQTIKTEWKEGGNEVDVLVMPTKSLVDAKGDPLENPLKLHMTRKKDYGVLFATVLLVVILITNVPLRGGWSFALIIFAILMAIIF